MRQNDKSNMVSREQATGRSPTFLICGIDSLYMSYSGSLQASLINLDDLAYLKDKARQERGDFEELAIGSECFAVMPGGAFPYRYVLRNRDFIVHLSEHMQPCCYVQFLSQGLWLKGAETMTGRLSDWLRSIGFYPSRPEVVSRCDWAFDYHLPALDFAPEHFISRAAKRARWEEHNKVQTLQFGKGDTVLRVYDKVAEIEQASAKAFFYGLWHRNSDVWRIEFQVRGPRLQQTGIHTLADLWDHQGDLLRELASRHTTLRRPGSDGNQSRWPLHPLWTDLQAQIAAMSQMGLIREFDATAPLDWRRYRLGKSMLGMLKSVGLHEFLQSDGSKVPDLEWAHEALLGLVRPHHNAVEWEEDLRRKIKAEGYGL